MPRETLEPDRLDRRVLVGFTGTRVPPSDHDCLQCPRTAPARNAARRCLFRASAAYAHAEPFVGRSSTSVGRNEVIQPPNHGHDFFFVLASVLSWKPGGSAFYCVD